MRRNDAFDRAARCSRGTELASSPLALDAFRDRHRLCRSWLARAVVVAAGIAGVRNAHAQDPCVEDAKQFCGEVKVGSGRVQECLRQNEAKLSPACKEKRKATEAKFRDLIEEFGKACGRDMRRLCNELQPGAGRVAACLMRQEDDLSSSCRAKVERVQAAAETISAVRAACRADAERLCAGVPAQAAPLIECLQANRANLSETCRALGPEAASVPAELVDAVDSLKSEERSQEVRQILQGIESVAFTRSQVLFQLDSFNGIGRVANANRLLFNPQVVFGGRNQFAVQLKVPVISVYPYSPSVPAKTGLGGITTALAWAFFASKRVNQYLGFGLQWKSPEQPPVGSAWAVIPTYSISIGIAGPLLLNAQVVWVRSFASGGYPDLNLLLFEPIIVLNLPGRTFVALDSKLAWNFADSSFLPLLKGIAGLYLDRRKSVSISAWYQAFLGSGSEAETDPGSLEFKYEVGAALSYFFDL
jgi:hypothetical protein